MPVPEYFTIGSDDVLVTIFVLPYVPGLPRDNQQGVIHQAMGNLPCMVGIHLGQAEDFIRHDFIWVILLQDKGIGMIQHVEQQGRLFHVSHPWGGIKVGIQVLNSGRYWNFCHFGHPEQRSLFVVCESAFVKMIHFPSLESNYNGSIR